MKTERPYQPHAPYEPRKPLKEWYVERKNIYDYNEIILHDDYEGEFEDEEEALEKNRKYPKPDDITLAWLIDNLPKGITPEQIKVDFGYEARSHYAHSLGFYYEVQTPKLIKDFEEDLAEYEKDLLKYQSDLKQYEEDKQKYEEWERQNQIEKAEALLKKLKGTK